MINNIEMEQKPFVSVIVPVYNAEKYLPACLDSICNQTLQELEIIVVDDGSTDNSGRIVDEYAARDNRIKAIHRRSGNPGATRNIGLGLVTGEYVGFVDADDWVEPDMFVSLFRKAKENNSDVVITGVTTEWLQDDRKTRRYLDESNSGNLFRNSLDAFWLLKENNLFAVVYNKLYRSELLISQNICFMEMLPYEDLVFNLQVFSFTKQLSFIPNNCPYHYICRGEMSAAGSFSPNHLQACKNTENAFRQFFGLYGFSTIQMELFLRNRRVSDYVAYAAGFYKKNSLLKHNERVKRLEDDFFKNINLKRDILLSPPVGFYQKMFCFFLFYTTPVITDYFYQFLFYMRYHFDPVYRKFRLFISR